ncbi:MAG: hypothetical protein WAS36_00410 [Candidatus Saccharimonadales bacterium]
MATKKSASDRKVIDKIFILLGGVATVFLLVVGGLTWYGYTFATNMVTDQLTAQKIFFPPAGSEALPADKYPNLQQYGGKQVVDGVMAEAYANEFIGSHLAEVAGGKTYSEVSTAARQNPANVELQQQKATLFQGETLRGLLLGSGYGYWTFGMIAKWVAIASFLGAALMGVLTLLGVQDLRRRK